MPALRSQFENYRFYGVYLVPHVALHVHLGGVLDTQHVWVEKKLTGSPPTYGLFIKYAQIALSV